MNKKFSLEKILELDLRSRSGQVRSEQAVVAHACHGHRYRPSLVPLSGTRIIELDLKEI